MSRKVKKVDENLENSIAERIYKLQLREVNTLPEEKRKRLLEITGKERKKISQTPSSERITQQYDKVQKAEDIWVEIISEINENENHIKQVKEKKQDAELALKKAREEYDKVTQQLRAEEKTNTWLQKKLEKAKNEYIDKRKLLDEMLKIVLVHPSASIKQIFENEQAEFWIMRTEEEMLQELFPDNVIDCDWDDNFIEYLPKGIIEKYDDNTIKAMVDYCNWVIITKLITDELEDRFKDKDDILKTQIVPLFEDEDIAEILRINGYNF